MPPRPREKPDASGASDKGHADGPGPTQEPAEALADRKWTRTRLLEEIERQSDVGAVNLDLLVELYHKEYADPLLHLLEDVQTLASVYSNVFETLKTEGDVGEAAAVLKKRYVELGLIPQHNQWPNPLADRLMRHCLDKLHQYRKALLDLIRSRGRQLLAELNFDASMSVSFQLSMGTDTSFAITVQPAVGVGLGS